jgi:hypothetical protein
MSLTDDMEAIDWHTVSQITVGTVLNVDSTSLLLCHCPSHRGGGERRSQRRGERRRGGQRETIVVPKKERGEVTEIAKSRHARNTTLSCSSFSLLFLD